MKIMLMNFVKSIPSPIIIFGVIVVLSLLWNVYMEFSQKRKFSEPKLDTLSSKLLLKLSGNIVEDHMRLVNVSGYENSEETISDALKFLRVNQQTEIKIYGQK